MSATYAIDCSSPVSDNLIKLDDLVQYLHSKMKVSSLRNNLNGKVTIEADTTTSRAVVTASVKYSKRAVRYYSRKFLQKMQLHQRFRVVSTTKDTYELRPYGVSTKE